VILLAVSLAIIGLLLGLRFWPVVINIALAFSGAATAKHDASGPSDAFKTKVTRIVVIAGGAWFLLFSSIAVLVSRVMTSPAGWVAFFAGFAFTGCFAVANYALALRRLHQRAEGPAEGTSVRPISKVRTFLKWCSKSLVGHIVLCQLMGALPMFILFTYLNYTEGTLTPSWGVWVAFVAECFGLFMAMFLWFGLSRWVVYLPRDTAAMKALLAKNQAERHGSVPKQPQGPI
jgi:hypothetical protein